MNFLKATKLRKSQIYGIWRLKSQFGNPVNDHLILSSLHVWFRPYILEHQLQLGDQKIVSMMPLFCYYSLP